MDRITVWLVAFLFVGSVFAEPPVPPPQPPRPARMARVLEAPSGAAADNAISAKKALLEKKLADRDRLQAEIDALQFAIGTWQQILVRLQVVEVSRTKLRNLGIEWQTTHRSERNPVDYLVRGLNDAQAFEVLDRPQVFQGFISALAKNNVARVLAEPNIVVTCGRHASLRVGGATSGTQVDLVATRLGGDKVRLDMKICVNGSGPTDEGDTGKQVAVPSPAVPPSTRKINTAVDVPLGHTAVLGGMVHERTEVHITEEGLKNVPVEVQTLFLVTPEPIEPVADAVQ